MLDNTIEYWKPIKGYEGIYEISNRGRILSFKFNKGKVLKPWINAYGYPTISLCDQGKLIQHQIHKLVCYHFISEHRKGYVPHHEDDDKLNNYSDNIVYITRSEHSKIHNPKGKAKKKRLSIRQVAQIKMLLKLKIFTINEIAKKYGIQHLQISRINTGDRGDKVK